MSFRLLTLLLLVYCCHLISATKRIRIDGKSYTVSAYPEDCSKYVMCSNGKCKLETCEPTYVFDPVTSTCSHRRRFANCDFSLPRKL
ncbi:Chitin-binding type-2 domain-containing protein [Camponotus japonicus]